jgi:hypothetical protein
MVESGYPKQSLGGILNLFDMGACSAPMGCKVFYRISRNLLRRFLLSAQKETFSMRPVVFSTPIVQIEADPQLGFGRPITPIVVPIRCMKAPYMVIRRVIGQPQLRIPDHFLVISRYRSYTAFPWNSSSSLDAKAFILAAWRIMAFLV